MWTVQAKFGRPQESTISPTIFSISCNDRPDIVENKDDIHMYVDDTTTYVSWSLSRECRYFT